MENKKRILFAAIFFLPFFCKAQVEKWDSLKLKNYVDSTGIIPANVDLSSLHLKTATRKDFWAWADTVQPVKQEFIIKSKKRKRKNLNNGK